MKRVLLMSAAGLLLAHNAMAGMNNCAFALHWKVNTAKTSTICTTYSPNGTLTPCDGYITAAPLSNTTTPVGSQVYMVVARGGTEGINAVSFGIDYNGRLPGSQISPALVTATYCTDGLAFPNDGGFGEFPKPKGGVRVTWTTCSNTVIGSKGVHAMVGALYVYAYTVDQMKITPNNNLASGPELAVSSCAGVVTDLLQVWGPVVAQQLQARVDFGGGAGFNPCLTTPVQPTTWGRIKTQFNAQNN